MIETPFSLFEQFSDKLRVHFYVKDDGISSDDQLNESNLVSTKQVHGNRTIVVHAPMLRTEEADGMIMNEKNLTLSLRVADCQSFIIYEPKKNTVGLLHAGWKGLIRGAIPEFFKTLQNEFDINPSETFVGAGPSLCLTHAEFTDPTKELPNIDPKYFQGRNVDLTGIANDQFFDLGVSPEHFERNPDCTKCESSKYWSYRAEKEPITKGYENVLTCTLL